MNELRLKWTRAQREVFRVSDYPKYSIVPKGRQVGITQGGAQKFIVNAVDGMPSQLWVDTINGNIDRYFDRVFLPILKNLTTVKWNWHAQKRELKIGSGIIDFRSADKPENIEGFNYWLIFLNEAGIILKDDYLYTNSILPMLLRYPHSKLIAAGVPKGKFKKDGSEHKFYQLWLRATSGAEDYRPLHYTSYDNPSFLNKEDIDKMILEIPPAEVRQEIYGEFIEHIGNNPFFFNYKPELHESEQAVFDPRKAITISIDFNVEPFAVTFSHLWQDVNGVHDHQFDEAAIRPGSIPAMIDLIKERYGKYIQGCRITGDAMGKSRNLSERDNASNYKLLARGLGLSESQVVVPGDPRHGNSRTDCNYILLYHPDFRINPKTCPRTCYDLRNVQVDVYGEKVEIRKSDRTDVNQQADFCDAVRYKINTFHKQWILRHKK